MGSACDHEHHDHPPGAAVVARALDEAEQRCTADGDRMTTPRRRVLELLLTAGEPVKAYDLISRFGPEGQAAKPPTVYRALEFLERKGMAHRIASISAYVACTATGSAGGETHTAAFLICDCCGATQEVSAPVAAELDRVAMIADYVIEHTTIEAHGRCGACRKPA